MTGRVCREVVCKRDIILLQLDSGSWIPVDPEAIPRPAASLVAVNHTTGRGRVLRKVDINSGDADRWATKGSVTFHRAHMATCVARKKRQLALDVP